MSEGIFRIIGTDAVSPAFERAARDADRAAERLRAAMRQAAADDPTPPDSGSPE